MLNKKIKFNRKIDKEKISKTLNYVEMSVSAEKLAISFVLGLALLGAAIICFPKLMAVLFGSFLFMLSAAIGIGAWKIYKLKETVMKQFKQFEDTSAIVVQQVKSEERDITLEAEVDEEGNKIVWH